MPTSSHLAYVLDYVTVDGTDYVYAYATYTAVAYVDDCVIVCADAAFSAFGRDLGCALDIACATFIVLAYDPVSANVLATRPVGANDYACVIDLVYAFAQRLRQRR